VGGAVLLCSVDIATAIVDVDVDVDVGNGNGNSLLISGGRSRRLGWYLNLRMLEEGKGKREWRWKEEEVVVRKEEKVAGRKKRREVYVERDERGTPYRGGLTGRLVDAYTAS
jgi:hypothetical protein